MNFGDILDQWENREKDGTGTQENPMESWLSRYGAPEDLKDDEENHLHSSQQAAYHRKYLRQLPPQDELDLHGLTAENALVRVQQFLEESVRKGLEKVLIIHGKGNHSDDSGVLKKAVRDFIEKSSLAGEFGYADRSHGGSGALWVILRQRSR